MRLNHPVNNVEYPFPSGQTLVSTTDLKGRITYCNAAFVTVSGFERDELMGQPHNLIRHPDMPEEAFRDLWATIESGNPWSGLVKNRRKDGSYYWVQANVTPLVDGGTVTGFLSVRTEASKEAIVGAEQLYALMRSEKETGRIRHVLHSGYLIRPGLGGKLERLGQHKAEIKMFIFCAFLLLVGWGLGAWWAASPGWVTVAAGWVGGGLICMVTAWTLLSMTMRPLASLQTFANKLASGDLSVSLQPRGADTIGRFERSLNQLCVNIRSIVRDVRHETEQMQTVTREIASGNLELSSRTESQASSLEETASSMEEITGTVRQSAEASRHVAELSSQASEITQRSSHAVHTVATTMKTISESSRRIGEINQVIDSIAFQTNILALNAAVEAARAGEQGRGFAVVASEVRALAQRTSSAAKEIKGLIEASVTHVDDGERQALEAQSTLDQAVSTVQNVTTLINEINNGAREQLLGISQVNEAVSQMDTITQQNAAMVEELASSAASLETQSASVAESVRIFKIGTGSGMSMPDAVQLRKASKARMGEAH